MQNSIQMLVDSIITKSTPSGTTLYKVRFFDANNNIYAYDSISADSIRLNFLLSAAGLNNDGDVSSLIGKTVFCTIVEKIGINRKDNHPFTSLVVDKYQTKGE